MIYQIRQSEGAALAPLSPKQKQKLAAMARFAYEEVAPLHQTFDEWRRAEVFALVKKAGLTKCVNEDYNPLKAHFLALSGNPVGSLKATLKGLAEPRSSALFHLHKACTEAKDVMPEAMKYARGFVRNKRGISLDDADERTIWHAVFLVRRKAQSLRKKKKAGGQSAADVLGSILGPIPTTRHVKGPF